MKTFKIGGVHPKDQKLSADKAIDTLPLPKQAIIPLSQHIGAPATPVVAKGDYVRVGQIQETIDNLNKELEEEKSYE